MAQADEKTCEVIKMYRDKKGAAPYFNEIYSAHVNIPSLNIEIKGVVIRYTEKTGRVWVMMPSKKGLLDGKMCYFPLLSFNDKEFQKKIQLEIAAYFLEWRQTHKFEELEKAYDTPRKPQKPAAKPEYRRPDHDPSLSRLFPRRNTGTARSD